MTLNRGKLFHLATVALTAILITGCPPNKPLDAQEEGTFVVSRNKLYDQSSDFDLRWTAVYPKKEEGFNPSINVSNQELTFNRCTSCHECGFKPAFDYDNYGKPGWDPRYTGQQWTTIVERMNQKEGSMMNEQVAQRVFTFLRDSTLGQYDETTDPGGAIVVEVDPDEAGRLEAEATDSTGDSGSADSDSGVLGNDDPEDAETS